MAVFWYEVEKVGAFNIVKNSCWGIDIEEGRAVRCATEIAHIIIRVYRVLCT